MRVQMRCGPICRRGERHKSLGVKLVRATNNICLVEDISVDLVLSVGPSCDHDKRDPFNGSRVINTLGAISCYRQEPPINKYSHNPAPSTCSMCTSQSVTIFLFFSGIITLFSVSGEDLAGKRSNFLSDTKWAICQCLGSVTQYPDSSPWLSGGDGARNNQQRRLTDKKFPDGDPEPERQLGGRGEE